MSGSAEEVAFNCPHCRTPVSHSLSASSELTCSECNQDVALQVDGIHPATRQVQHCLVCGNKLLYVQKDFNRKLGIWIVIVGAAVSIWLYFTSLYLALVSLAVAAALDFLLYHLLGDVTVCYRCEAIHRGFPLNHGHSTYDLHVAEQFERG